MDAPRQLHIAGTYTNWYSTVTIDGRTITPDRSQEVFDHSPDGFSWGFGGSGPAQLALAILLEAGVTTERAVQLHQRFKAEFLAPLDPDGPFVMHLDVVGWAHAQR